MNENERREVMLEQMRNHSIPVVHPRYRASYNSVYQTEKKTSKKSGFMSMLLILFFIGIGYYTYIEQPVIDTGYIIDRIEQEVGHFIDLIISG
jgi:hypothetical protein